MASFGVALNHFDVAMTVFFLFLACIAGFALGRDTSDAAYRFKARRRELESAEKMAIIAANAEREKMLFQKHGET